MHVDYTPQQKALRAEIRAYFSELMTPELRSGLEGGSCYREVWLRGELGEGGERGWRPPRERSACPGAGLEGGRVAG